MTIPACGGRICSFIKVNNFTFNLSTNREIIRNCEEAGQPENCKGRKKKIGVFK
jgi:hypothetical protein